MPSRGLASWKTPASVEHSIVGFLLFEFGNWNAATIGQVESEKNPNKLSSINGPRSAMGEFICKSLPILGIRSTWKSNVQTFYQCTPVHPIFCSYRGKVLDAAISQDESLHSNAWCKPRVNFEDDQLRKLLKENKTSWLSRSNNRLCNHMVYEFAAVPPKISRGGTFTLKWGKWGVWGRLTMKANWKDPETSGLWKRITKSRGVGFSSRGNNDAIEVWPKKRKFEINDRIPKGSIVQSWSYEKHQYKLKYMYICQEVYYLLTGITAEGKVTVSRQHN